LLRGARNVLAVPTYIVFYVLEFSDDGESEIGVLGEGTKEDCERILSLVPAVAYSGERPDPSISVGIAEMNPRLER
jgi:hypothetical protein